MKNRITFEEAWKLMERAGYQYGEDALAGVRLGWGMREEYSNDRDLEHYREAGMILHVLLGSATMDGSVREAASAWVKKDLELKASSEPPKAAAKKSWGMKGQKWGGKKK